MNNPAQLLFEQADALAAQYSIEELERVFDRPVVILSAPRSGSTLLYETLIASDDVWSINGESHIAFSGFPQLHPSNRGFVSGALTAEDASDEVCHRIRALFLVMAVDNKGRRYLDIPESQRPASIRFVEKTPRNALNTPFMKKLFPSMKAVFLYRDPRENISSIIEAWGVGLQSGRFVTFPNLPGWDKGRWCLLLPRGWQNMVGKDIADIAAFQWSAANATIIDDLESDASIDWQHLSYQRLVDEPAATVQSLADFIDIPFAGGLASRVSSSLPHSNTIVTAPKRDKWKRNETAIMAVESAFSPVEQRLASL